jgi:AcrR family transcriptional regulator
VTSQRNNHAPHRTSLRPAGRNTTAILDAASSAVAAVGLRRTTVADVARKAGVSRMTVYREYGDAAAVFRALLTREVEGVVAAATAGAADQTTGRDRLVEATIHAVEACIEHPLLQRLLDVDPEFLMPFVVERLGSSQRAVVAVLSDLLRAGMADGSIRSITDTDAKAAAEADKDVSTVAYTMLLTVQSFIFSSRITAAESDPTRVMAELRVLLDAYLRPQVTS